MTGAGDLNQRLHCQRKVSKVDTWSNDIPGHEFETAFTNWAAMTPLRGTEAVMANRLAGQQPYVVRLRNSSSTRQITVGWRFVDARNPKRVFAVTAPPADPDGTRQWLDVVAMEGGMS